MRTVIVSEAGFLKSMVNYVLRIIYNNPVRNGYNVAITLIEFVLFLVDGASDLLNFRVASAKFQSTVNGLPSNR